MKRDEAYNRIDAIIAKHEIDDEYVTITSSIDYDALRLARKLLEQEPVIIKIRAEIEAYAIHATDEKQRIAFNSCVNLIDHYTELKPN